MPLGVFVPAGLNDLAADVQVGTPARGSVFYRGASFWNALPPGTAGQVLTSGGAGANPSWTTPSGGGGGSVSLAPATSGQNLIQPTAPNTTALTLKAFNTDVNYLLFDAQDETGASFFSITSFAGIQTFGFNGFNGSGANSRGQTINFIGGQSTGSAHGGGLFFAVGMGSQPAGANLNGVAEVLHFTGNTPGGEMSFFAATPVIQQSLAAAATDPASTQALANSIRAALLAYGICV